MGMYDTNMSNFKNTAEAQIVEKIENLIAARGTTRKHVFDSARISRTTFERAMTGARSFTVIELMDIAEALNVTPDQLLPEEWGNSNKQAA